MDKDLNTRKRKKSVDDAARNVKKSMKNGSDTSITNTTTTLSASAANDQNTDIPMTPEITPEVTSITNSVTSAQGTNHSHSPVFTKDTKPVVRLEPCSKKEEKSEGAKKDEPRSKAQKAPIAPKGKYELGASTLIPRDYGNEDDEEENKVKKKNFEAVIDLAEDDEEEDEGKKKNIDAVIEFTADDETPVVIKEKPPIKKISPGVCVYVKKSCEPGPFLKQTKIASIPPVIGPAHPNIVLRQLVEHIVQSAHSSKQVLKLLASETDNMTISSIIKTLKNKLFLCENIISLNRVTFCGHCHAVKCRPEENRRLASLRTTRQREIKKTVSDTSITNTTSTSSASAANDQNTDIPMTPEITPEVTSIANSVTSAQGTNHSHSPVFTKYSKPVVKLKPCSKKEEKSEGAKKDEPRSEAQKAPIAPKGKYELGASTLIPRDYGNEDDEEEDAGKKKNFEADLAEDDEEEDEEKKKTIEAVIDLIEDDEEEVVIDLSENDETPVVTKEKTPIKKEGPGVCIYVKKSCEPGPFLKQTKIASIPPVIGPAGRNIVLRQLVEHIVQSTHSSKQVLNLLASETDKMTTSSIIKTLKTKLSLCKNFISLNRVAFCGLCDAVKGKAKCDGQKLI